MEKKHKFRINTTVEETEKRVKRYFIRNGYYELKAPQLCFTRDTGGSPILNPLRLVPKISFLFKSISWEQTQVYVDLNTQDNTLVYTKIDEDYYEDLLKHVEKCVTENHIVHFDQSKYVQEAKSINRTYLYVLVASWILLFGILALFSKYDYIGSFLFAGVLLCPVIAIWYINKFVLPKRRAAQQD